MAGPPVLFDMGHRGVLYRLILVAIAGMCLSACDSPPPAVPSTGPAAIATPATAPVSVHPALLSVFGADGIAILANPTGGEIQVAGGDMGKVSLDETTARRIASLLARPDSYTFESEDSYYVEQKITIRIESNGSSFFVFWDPECDVVTALRQEHEVGRAPGLVLTSGRPALVADLKSAWPNERAIQSLTPSNERIRTAFPAEVYDVIRHPDRVERIRILSSSDWRFIRSMSVNFAFYTRLLVHDLTRLGDPPNFDLRKRIPASVPGVETIEGWAVASSRNATDPAWIGDLSLMLLADHSYPRGLPFIAGCFEPGVAYRFHRGPVVVSVLVCFKCGNIAWSATGTTLAEPYRIGFSGFSERGWEDMARLTRRAFPADPDIQKLKDKRVE